MSGLAVWVVYFTMSYVLMTRVPLLLVADLKIFKQFCPQSQGVLGLTQVLNHKVSEQLYSDGT